MARLLAERLEEEGEPAGAEISVGELLERYVPYEVARRSLELTTKSEYDLMVLEFLADERLTALGDPEVAEAAGEELETPEPDLDPLEEHGDATLRLDLATISGGYRGSEPEAEDASADDEKAPEGGGAWDPTGGVDSRPEPEPDEGGGGGADLPVDIGPGPEAGGREGGARAGGGGREGGAGPEDEGAEGRRGAGADCRRCGGSLPVDAEVPVRFCPRCGAARPERACPECDARLRPEWTYCPSCGTHASPSGSGGSEPG